MTYADEATAANDVQWWPILRQAAIAYAITVIEEADTIPLHAQRAALAQTVLTDSQVGARIAPAMAGQGLSSTSIDSSLDAAIGGLWNYWAQQ